MTNTTTTITLQQAQEMARLLGPDWQALQTEDDSDTFRSLAYIGPDPDLKDLTLTCRADMYGHAGKWHWSANSTYHCGFTLYDHIPYDKRHTYTSSINVTPAKPLAQIARDLTRRLLDNVTPIYRQARQRYRESLACQASAQTLAQDLAQLLGHGARVRLSESLSAEQTVHSGGPLYVDLRLNGFSVRCEHFNMTPEQARQFCQLVATWRHETRKDIR
jgi:hypothetical protein